MTPSLPRTAFKLFKPLKGLRILSLALNLPGPAALMRGREMGATCIKLEPPPPARGPSEASVCGDPMSVYNPIAYAALHRGLRPKVADLKTDAGRRLLHRELARADVLITSFRPSALRKLGLNWHALASAYPALSQVAIVGGPGAAAETPGHDLTYLAANGLVPTLDLPPTLYADMAGSLQVTEAVLKAALHRHGGSGRGLYLEVALSDAAAYLALPRAWGLTQPGATVGGGHAGYRVYACQDGRVAVAALEPHFAAALWDAAGVPWAGTETMFSPATLQAITACLGRMTRAQLAQLALAKDIPLHTLPP
ncbi:MAG: L-carnitine dehydratase/bile acid-inducible protein [Rhodoferax sp.]|nr:L-carnitine dehydratase/bile acid-inducible protein [Rhodoferax sp.]